MAFSFEVKKPKDLQKALEQVKAELKKSNGSITGDVNSGSISTSGVKGAYTVTDDVINITVTDKPFLLPASVIKNEITKAFNEYYD